MRVEFRNEASGIRPDDKSYEKMLDNAYRDIQQRAAKNGIVLKPFDIYVIAIHNYFKHKVNDSGIKFDSAEGISETADISQKKSGILSLYESYDRLNNSGFNRLVFLLAAKTVSKSEFEEIPEITKSFIEIAKSNGIHKAVKIFNIDSDSDNAAIAFHLSNTESILH